MVNRIYRASKTKSKRPGWSVTFRHPRRTDTRNKYGLRVRHGLGTNDEVEAERLVEQLNELLADESWWSADRRDEAVLRFDGLVVSIFFDRIEVGEVDPRSLREQHIRLPSLEDGYSRVMLVGTTGAGKTTLLRHLIGSDHVNDRFPSTSTARTTTSDIEIVTGDGPFKAAVTFTPEHEARRLIDECLEEACLSAVQGGDDGKIADALLSHREQRFRLSYMVGSWPKSDTTEDLDFSFEDDEGQGELIPQDESVGESEESRNNANLREYIARIKDIAEAVKGKVSESFEVPQEVGGFQNDSDQDIWLEHFEEALYQSDEFADIASDLKDDIIDRSMSVVAGGFDRNSDGWPNLWKYEDPNRADFLRELRRFSSNHHQQFGKLLTPLVNGLRVHGPFHPTDDRLPANNKLVLLDGEGLGHTARSASSVSTRVTQKYSEVDMILLVDSSQQPMQAAPLQLLRSVGSSGYAHKLAIAFTHFDLVRGDNLGEVEQKKAHVLASVSNGMTNIREALGTQVAAALERQIESKVFFLGALDKDKRRIPNGVATEIAKLINLMEEAAKPKEPVTASPIYSFEELAFALSDAVENFRTPWRGRLGLEYQSSAPKEHWARIKALARRVAFGWNNNEYDYLRPVADYQERLQESISRWLENPVGWKAAVDEQSKENAIDTIRQKVFDRLSNLANFRVARGHRGEWEVAFDYRGRGSSLTRAQTIEQIYEAAGPHISFNISDPARNFVADIRQIIREAVEETGGSVRDIREIVGGRTVE